MDQHSTSVHASVTNTYSTATDFKIEMHSTPSFIESMVMSGCKAEVRLST